MPSKIPSQVHSRKFLLNTPLPKPVPNSNTPASGPSLSNWDASDNDFNANVVMILTVLMCTLICALGLNSIVRCALRASNRIDAEPETDQAGRVAATRVRRKAIRDMPVAIYSPKLELNGTGTECAICLSALVTGELVRVMPKCNHGFHIKCIDRWLIAHPTCPNCRQCLFTTDLKSSDCGEADAGIDLDTGTVLTIIVPLEQERFMPNYRT